MLHSLKKIDNSIFPLGKIQINSLKELTKVGSVLNKDFNEPSIFDLEDLQTLPKQLTRSSTLESHLTSSSSTSSLSSSESVFSPSFSTTVKKGERFEESTNEFRFKTDHFSDEDIENEDDRFKEKNAASRHS